MKLFMRIFCLFFIFINTGFSLTIKNRTGVDLVLKISEDTLFDIPAGETRNIENALMKQFSFIRAVEGSAIGRITRSSNEKIENAFYKKDSGESVCVLIDNTASLDNVDFSKYLNLTINRHDYVDGFHLIFDDKDDAQKIPAVTCRCNLI